MSNKRALLLERQERRSRPDACTACALTMHLRQTVPLRGSSRLLSRDRDLAADEAWGLRAHVAQMNPVTPSESPEGQPRRKTDSVHDVLREGRRSLHRIFHPRNVAVIGASETAGTVGRTLLIAAAAKHWGVAPATCRVRHGA